MSSPSNVVIVIDVPGVSDDECRKIAIECFAEWKSANPQNDPRFGGRYTLTQAVVEAFFERVISKQAYSPGAEGDMLVFAFAGNHVSEEDLLPVIADFTRRLDGDGRGGIASATVMIQPCDASAFVWKTGGDTDYKAVQCKQTDFSFEKN